MKLIKRRRRINRHRDRRGRTREIQLQRAAIRRALQQAWKDTQNDVANAFEAAGVEIADDLAQYLMNGAGAKNSVVQGQALRELLGAQPRNDHSEASRVLKTMDPHKFEAAINERLDEAALARLARHPPDDGKVYVGADQHFEDYKPSIEVVDLDGEYVLMPSEASRAAHAVYNSKSNARSHKADPFLGVAVIWRSKGVIHSAMMNMTFLWGLQVESKRHHLNRILQVRDRLPYKVVGLLVDAWYDATDLRRLAREAGLPIQHRLTLGPKNPRYIWLDGERHDIRDLAKAAFKDKTLAWEHIHRWGPDGAATRQKFKILQVRGILGREDPATMHPDDAVDTDVEIQIAARWDKAKQRDVLDWDVSGAVAMHGPPTHEMDFCYFLRWNLETLYQVFVDIKGRTAEQLVNRKIANVLIWTLLLTNFVALREILAEAMPYARLAGKPLIVLSIRTLIQLAFVVDAAT